MSAPVVVANFQNPIVGSSAESEGFRPFKIEAHGFVELPGCKKIEEVRLDGRTIPPYEDHRVPTDGTHTHFQDIRTPNYALMTAPSGNPAIVRGMNCNDGRWQVGSILHVKGTFEDDKAKK